MSIDSGISNVTPRTPSIGNGDSDYDGNDPIILTHLQRILVCSNCRNFIAISQRWIVRNELYMVFALDYTVAWDDSDGWHCSMCGLCLTTNEIPNDELNEYRGRNLFCVSRERIDIVFAEFNQVVENLE